MNDPYQLNFDRAYDPFEMIPTYLELLIWCRTQLGVSHISLQIKQQVYKIHTS